MTTRIPPDALAFFKAQHDASLMAMGRNPVLKVIGSFVNEERGQAVTIVLCSCQQPACSGIGMFVGDVLRGVAHFAPSPQQALDLADMLRKVAAT